ncbi:MAG: hypothetical protein KTR18_14035 [Acidiferrobacterales bacterium]|nr:hypothetical protein [Acidiferrobacterales bacterium]
MPIHISNEFSRLKKIIIGCGSPYQRDKEKVAREMHQFPLIPQTAWREQVLALSYPPEEQLIQEFKNYVEILQRNQILVLRPDTQAAYSFDYTCPRDIGFVIGDLFFASNMAVPSRSEEIKTIEYHLADIEADKIVRFTDDAIIEGGDVVQLDHKTVLVGINQRTNRIGFEQLRDYLEPLGYHTVPVEHQQLHLDCCLNPLGLGHLLIHPDSLKKNGEDVWKILNPYSWITVEDEEREHLATNILSIDVDRLIVRSGPHCQKTNKALDAAGYQLFPVSFDGTPATGGSFRCASLALSRK